MNKLLWLSAPLILSFSQSSWATTSNCNFSPKISYDRSTASIINFPYNQIVSNATKIKITTSPCNPAAAARSDFRVNSGNTDLTGTSPFGVKPSVNIIGLTGTAASMDAARNWLANNLKVSFDMIDFGLRTDIINQDTDYNILPTASSNGTTTTINGKSFATGNGNQGVFDILVGVPNVKIEVLQKPSADIVNALNGKKIEIHAGTMTIEYDNWNPRPTGITAKKSLEIYINTTLNFGSFPTCTMANQTVNLATVPTSMLNSNQTGNEQNFNVSINCTAAMPSKVLLATIKDSYTAGNVNTNGILINQPSLANRSNVDIQLRDGNDVPLAIGSQSSFYSIPAGSTATTFIKALKARYFRSAPTATPGYVQTQATVFLDYQ